MKKIIFSSLIIFLIFFTSIIKNSTKKIDNKIFNLKEDIRLLSEKYELVLLDYNFLSSPKKLAEILSHEDSTCDIADGVTIDVDDSCELVISDQTDYAFFSNYTERTNPQKLVGFADNVRSAIIKDTGLTGAKRVGYIPVPSYATDCFVDIDDTFTYTVDDGATLII